MFFSLLLAKIKQGISKITSLSIDKLIYIPRIILGIEGTGVIHSMKMF